MAEGETEAVVEEQAAPPAEEPTAPQGFQVPDAVAQAFLNGDLAIIAGAGVGVDAAFPFTFAEDVIAELQLNPEGMAFPDVMSAYERRHGRIGLLERIKERLDYVKSFPELNDEATRFHRELSSAYTVNDIYTTDWDDSFERECGAVPFAADRDWAFWRLSGRKVFKIHGGLSSPASLIATDADYSQCYGKLDHSIVWEKLEQMLEPKTIVFVGFGFHDTDFNAMCGAFHHRMKQLIERSYVVTEDDAEPSQVAGMMQTLRVDPLTFVQKLKELYPPEDFVADDRFEGISDFKEDVRVEREQMIEEGDIREDGEMLLAAAYQDGLLHTCEHIEANRADGRYSSRRYVDQKIAGYGQLREMKVQAKHYEDVAYIDGSVNGLSFLLADDDEREKTPLYYVFGHEGPLTTLEQFRQAAGQAESLDAEAHERGTERAASLEPGAEYRHSTSLF